MMSQESLLTTNYKQNITPPYCIGKEGYFYVIGNSDGLLLLILEFVLVLIIFFLI